MINATNPNDGEALNVPDGARRVTEIKAMYEALRDRWKRFRIQAVRNYEHLSGDGQISDEKRKELDTKGRPALVYNFLQNKIVTLAGLLESNRVYLKAVPMREGDNELADMHSVLVSDWAIKGCNGYEEFIRAALDAAIAKIGWTNNYWTDLYEPEGSWVTQAFDPLMIMFDPDARRQDQKDWRFYCVTAWYSCDEIIQVYKRYLTQEDIAYLKQQDERIMGLLSQRDKTKPIGWIDRIMNGVTGIWDYVVGPKPEGSDTANINDYVDTRSGRYRVLEWHDKRFGDVQTLYCPFTRERGNVPTQHDNESEKDYTGRIQAEITRRSQENGQEWMLDTQTREVLYITAVAPGLLPYKQLMEVPYTVQGRGFQHKPIFCYNFHVDITKTNSILDVLIDPQTGINQRKMTMLEMIMQSVNPDWMMPNGMLQKPADVATWQDKQRGKVRTFEPMMGFKPEPIVPVPQALASLQAFVEEDLAWIDTHLVSITPNSQGNAENSSESGILYAQRVQQAMVALSYFFGNVNDAMKEVFRYCDKNLQVFMAMPRKVRLLSKSNDPEWLALNQLTIQGVHNDVTEGEYDFVLDTTRVGETTRQAKFAEMLEFIKVLITIDPAYVKVDEMFKLWDSPSAEAMGEFAAKMQAIRMTMLGMQVQQAQQQQQMQVQAQAAQAGQAQLMQQQQQVQAQRDAEAHHVAMIGDTAGAIQQLDQAAATPGQKSASEYSKAG